VRHRLRTPVGIAALIGTVILASLTVLGPVVWGDHAALTVVSDRLAAASPDHPFGTDELGRDMLARVLVATRLSILLTLGAAGIAVIGGLALGLIATALPRTPRRMLTGLLDILLAFPWLLLVLFFTVIWGASAIGAMLAVGFAGIPGSARIAYTLASSISGREYVKAARVAGIGPFEALWRHVLPNITGPLLVNTAAVASVTLLSFAALSFLGLGVQAPEYDWGALLQDGIRRIYVNPIAAIGPGLAIVLAGLVFSLVSESLSETRGAGMRATAAAARAAIAGDRARLRRSARSAAAIPSEAGAPVAEIRGLRVSFPDGAGGLVERVSGVDLTVDAGEVVGIVGESGSGKSLTVMALAGLLEPPAIVTSDAHRFDSIDLAGPLGRAELARLGVEIGVVFQDPLTSLNPALTIGRQLTEVPEEHLGMSRREARARAVEALRSVSIAEPERRLRHYPYEFSGGMRQRAMIGMTLTARPLLLIADEPTTALDVTVQRQVLSVLKRAQRETGAAIVFISHDIALVSSFCDRVVVMKDGRVVEQLDARRIREEAQHPYTRGLIACLPHMATDRTAPLPVIADEEGSTT
jgi:peptide/nickel transport system permease protein